MGALHLWFDEFSLNRLIAAIAAGAAFCSIYAFTVHAFCNKDSTRIVLVSMGIPAGMVGGIVYWTIAVPEVSPFWATLIGVILGSLFAVS